MSLLPSDLYQEKLKKGELTEDASQVALFPIMDEFVKEIESDVTEIEKKNLFAWGYETQPKGLYMFGTVGRGKSMLMQLIFDAVSISEKRRVHFHPFMEEIHERMQHTQVEKGVDLMHKIASDIAKESRLLCFDEFYVTNIGDAMLLGRLLESLFNCGVVLCATSNWAPKDLYQDGHNRSRFMPFMKMVQNNMAEIDLEEGQDWRLTKGDDDKASHDTPEKFFKKTEESDFPLGYLALQAHGHEEGKLWVSFDSLCGQNLGRGEFMELANQIEHLILSDIPLLNEKSDMAMRFVVLIDILYELGKKVSLFSEHEIKDLCTEGPTAFAFERTISRLHEMGVR